MGDYCVWVGVSGVMLNLRLVFPVVVDPLDQQHLLPDAFLGLDQQWDVVIGLFDHTLTSDDCLSQSSMCTKYFSSE